MRSSFRVPTEAPASNKMPNSAFPIDLKEHQRDYCDVTPSARPPLSKNTHINSSHSRAHNTQIFHQRLFLRRMGVKIHKVSIKSNPVRASSCNLIFDDMHKTFCSYLFSNSTISPIFSGIEIIKRCFNLF